MPFSSLGLSSALDQAAADQGYATPTPIQRAAMPAILDGHDVLGLAQTGSGKTAAFSLPLLQRWAATPSEPGSRRAVHTLILVPTRELAAQVGDMASNLARRLRPPPRTLSVFGGVSINPQLMALRGGADLVIGTPGRLLDLVEHNALTLSSVAALVLDEADRLLDLGFADELARILELLPAQRQTLLFSATLPPAIQSLAERVLRDPVRIEIASDASTTPDITQRAIEVDAARRTQLLRSLIHEQRWSRVLVFVATTFAADRVAEKLRKAGIQAEPFHGQMSQGKRSQVVDDFKASRVRVVLATDLAARGLDIAQLPVVINYDLPRSAVDYVHRIGRTGRAGESGLAVSFVTPDSAAHFRLIEKRHGLAIPREQIAGFEPTTVASPVVEPERSGTGGVKGKRPSKKDKLRAAQAAQGKPQDLRRSGAPLQPRRPHDARSRCSACRSASACERPRSCARRDPPLPEAQPSAAYS